VERAAQTPGSVIYADSVGLPSTSANFAYDGVNSVLSVFTGFYDARDNAGLRFYEATVNGTNKITLKAPANLAADYSMELPPVAGTRYQFIEAGSAGSATNSFSSFPTHPVLEDHFIVTSINAAVGFAWVAAAVNGGTATFGAPFATRNDGFGYASLNTGTTSNNNASESMSWASSVNNFIGNTHPIHASTVIFWPTIATAVVDTINRFGYSVTAGSAIPTAGVYFEHQRVVNTAFWTCVTRSSSVSTVINTTVPIVAGQLYLFEIRWNPGSVQFYIDGVLVGTSTTNIPTVALCWRYCIGKIGAITAVSSSMGIDYFQCRFMPT
jgi:hypothetical protein